MIKYVLAFLVTFAVLVFLRFCEGTPFRTWKSVFLTAIPLALLAGYYFNHAPLKKPAPLPQSQKADAYRAELERTCRRIAGVDRASIEGTTVLMNFADYKPLPELKQIAREVGGTASWFLRTNNQRIAVKVRISIQGKDRYEIELHPDRGVVDEQEL
jgi:hypothetical protein